MKLALFFFFAAGILLVTDAGSVFSSSSARAFGASLYRLTEESNYQEGCFDPCMCPILLNQTLRGTFYFDLISQAENVTLFEIADVDWHFTQGDETVFVTGSGLYQMGLEQHQLALDLQIGDLPVQHFESGLVPLQSEIPPVSIPVALNGFFCYDYVFAITALPAAVEGLDFTWGSLKSVYR